MSVVVRRFSCVSSVPNKVLAKVQWNYRTASVPNTTVGRNSVIKEEGTADDTQNLLGRNQGNENETHLAPQYLYGLSIPRRRLLCEEPVAPLIHAPPSVDTIDRRKMYSQVVKRHVPEG